MPTVVIDGAAVQRFLNSPDGPVLRHLSELGTRVQERARAKVGVATGATRDRIVKRIATESSRPVVLVGVFAGLRPDGTDAAAVARYHHEGTRPHRITGDPLLRFFWPRVGRIVYFPYVNHPGTRGNPFLTQALEEVARER